MNSTQTAKYNMYNILLAFLAAYATLFVGFKRLLTEIATFTAAVITLKKLLPEDTKSAKTTTSITVEKLSDLDSMIAQALGMARLAWVWANDNGMSKIIAALKVTNDSFKGAESKAVALARTIYNIIEANQVKLVTDTEITDEQVEALKTITDLAEAEIGLPVSQRGLSKTVGISIEEAYTSVDDSAAMLQKLLLGKYAKGLPAENTLCISDMNTAVKLHVVKRFTALHIFFKELLTGKVIEGVKFDIPDLKKTGESDIDGFGEVPSLKPKKAHASFVHPLYEVVEMDVEPKKGKTVVMNVEMKLASPPSEGGI